MYRGGTQPVQTVGLAKPTPSRWRWGQRGRRSPAVVGLVILVCSLGGLVIEVAHASGSRLAQRASGAVGTTGGHEREAAAFFDDARQSLSHLLVSAPQLSTLLAEVDAGSQPGASVAELSRKWADDFATSRDLVGRLPLPGFARGLEVRSLYEMGAALYGEVARGVPRLVALTDPGERRETLKALRRLELLGERVFDAGHRLLRVEGGGDGIVVGRILPEEVPDFAQAGLEPSDAATGPVLAANGVGPPPTVSAAQWVARQKHGLANGIQLLATSASWLSSPPADTGPIRQAAAALEALSRQLGGPGPSGGAAREGAQDLRLALLVASESLRTLDATSRTENGQLEQARRLRLISERLWTTSTGMLVSGKAGSPPLYALAPSGIDPALLRTGGLFNGHPPALHKGVDPGQGVPGGLPPVDAGMVFRGGQH